MPDTRSLDPFPQEMIDKFLALWHGGMKGPEIEEALGLTRLQVFRLAQDAFQAHDRGVYGEGSDLDDGETDE